MLKKIFETIGSFLKNYINPFLTPFFALMAYVALTDEKLRSEALGVIFLVVTIVYFIVTLALAIRKVWMLIK